MAEEENTEIATESEDVSLGDAITAGHAEVNLQTIYDIPVEISVVLGRTQMPVSNLLKLGRGAVIELDRKVGESLDIYVNDRLVARGEVVIVENRIGVTLTEIIKPEK